MKYSEEFFKEVCNYLGSDLDSPPCQLLKEHLNDNPNCKAFIEKIRRTIEIIQAADACEPVPEDLNQKLLKCLNLDVPNSNLKF